MLGKCCTTELQPQASPKHYLFFKKIYDSFILYFMCIGVKVSSPLELDFQTVVSCHVGPLEEQSVLLTTEPFLQLPHPPQAF